MTREHGQRQTDKSVLPRESPRPPEPPVRDSQGRDTRIHGLVLDDANPGPTMRELLRQWMETGLRPPGSLAERTQAVLDVIGVDGHVVREQAPESAEIPVGGE